MHIRHTVSTAHFRSTEGNARTSDVGGNGLPVTKFEYFICECVTIEIEEVVSMRYRL